VSYRPRRARSCACRGGKVGAGAAGTQFTCFTSTKVQILTVDEFFFPPVLQRSGREAVGLAKHAGGAGVVASVGGGGGGGHGGGSESLEGLPPSQRRQIIIRRTLAGMLTYADVC
jgi:hypothetical protein